MVPRHQSRLPVSDACFAILAGSRAPEERKKSTRDAAPQSTGPAEQEACPRLRGPSRTASLPAPMKWLTLGSEEQEDPSLRFSSLELLRGQANITLLISHGQLTGRRGASIDLASANPASAHLKLAQTGAARRSGGLRPAPSLAGDDAARTGTERRQAR